MVAGQVRAEEDGHGRRLGHDHLRPHTLRGVDRNYGWITALRDPAIGKLLADDGPLQLGLFDEQDLAETTAEDFPGERLVTCATRCWTASAPASAMDLLGRHREAARPPHRPRPGGQAHRRRRDRHHRRQGDRKHKMAKHFEVTITDTSACASPAGSDQINKGPARRELRDPHARPGSELDPPRAWSPPTRASIRRSGTSARHQNPTTWIAAVPSTTASENLDAIVLICMLAGLPHLAPAPGLGAADLHRRGPARPVGPVTPPAAPRPLRQGIPQHDEKAAPTAASAAC